MEDNYSTIACYTVMQGRIVSQLLDPQAPGKFEDLQKLATLPLSLHPVTIRFVAEHYTAMSEDVYNAVMSWKEKSGDQHWRRT